MCGFAYLCALDLNQATLAPRSQCLHSSASVSTWWTGALQMQEGQGQHRCHGTSRHGLKSACSRSPSLNHSWIKWAPPWQSRPGSGCRKCSPQERSPPFPGWKHIQLRQEQCHQEPAMNQVFKTHSDVGCPEHTDL